MSFSAREMNPAGQKSHIPMDRDRGACRRVLLPQEWQEPRMVAGDEAELLRHPEHPLCPGKGELRQAVPPCHQLGAGDNVLVTWGGAPAGCPPSRGVMPL